MRPFFIKPFKTAHLGAHVNYQYFCANFVMTAGPMIWYQIDYEVTLLFPKSSQIVILEIDSDERIEDLSIQRDPQHELDPYDRNDITLRVFYAP